MGKAHDVHGFHGFLEVVFVLLPRNRDVTIGQETVTVESFQKQVRCGKTNRKTLTNMVIMTDKKKTPDSIKSTQMV